MWHTGRAHFKSHGHNLSKIGRGPLGDAKVKALCLLAADKKIFSCFPYVSLCLTCDTQGGSILSHRGMIWTKLVEVQLVMPHTIYYSPCGFRQENFSRSYKRMHDMWPIGWTYVWLQNIEQLQNPHVKHVTPWAWPNLTQGSIMVSDKKMFHVFPINEGPQRFWGPVENCYLFSEIWGALVINVGKLGTKLIVLGI